MIKKIIGFLIPIIGIVLLFEYLNSKKVEKETFLVKKTPRKANTKIQLKNTNLNERQQSIVKLFNKRDVLLPTDIYSVAPNLSTRTLRRDMDRLVELGIVKKEGSTKDTRYRIIK